MTAVNTTPRSGTSVAQPGMLGQAKVRPEDARRYNRSLVLSVLFREAPMSRADLARATGLTRVTISALVADLRAAPLPQPALEARLARQHRDAGQ